MTLHLVRLELRLLTRERSIWVTLALFSLAAIYGLWNGSQLAQRQRELVEAHTKQSERFDAQLRQHLTQNDVDTNALARVGSTAILPPAPMPLLAVGQSDISPGHETVALWRLAAPSSSRSELQNPSHLLAGRFDLAFVLVWIFPLCLLAVVYDLLAGDREAGTLRLALAQGVAPWGLLTRRALARAAPIVSVALFATFVAGISGGPSNTGTRVALALALVLAYGLFWVSLSLAVNAVARSAAGAATSLGAAWVLLVLVAPTLLNVVVESLYPTPSRPELVAAGRKAAGEAQRRGGELLDSFYRDHPELAPIRQQADIAAQRLILQEETGRALDPVRQKFDEQLERQQSIVARWRFSSPAIAMHETLNDLAGTGHWRNRAFREQVHLLRQAISDFFTPRIHTRQPVRMADIDKLPRFQFKEEPTEFLIRRVALSLTGMLVFSAALSVWTWRMTRPVRLGQIAS